MQSENALHKLYKAAYRVLPPATAATVYVSKQDTCIPVTTGATAFTLTLARPTKDNIRCIVLLDTDGGGDLTLTVTGGYNAEASTSIVFADAGDFVAFVSVRLGSTYYWRVRSQEGTTAYNAQDKMSPSTVIDATIEQYVSSVRREGNLIKTEILIDLTGAASTTTDKDIIGATGACHFGQITTAINGTILCGQMTCLEVPATGADDLDLYMSSDGTGAYDADGSALANAASLITKGGAWALSAPGAATAMTAKVTADYYLYILGGEAGTVGTYTAGKFLIELWGLPA